MALPSFIPQTLAGCVLEPLQQGQMSHHLPDALLTKNKTQVLIHDEGELWDFKERPELDTPTGLSRLARLVLSFHNSRGGVVIYGVTSDYRLAGLPQSTIPDKSVLWNKLREYIKEPIPLHQGRIVLPTGRYLWLVFVPRRAGRPLPVAANGPMIRGKYELRKGDYYVRIGDETKLCSDPGEYERLFAGYSLEHLHAYVDDVDEPYFRLLAPHCEQFVGRRIQLQQLADAMASRHPIITLDGLGGIGKTAVAIHYVRTAFDERRFAFIVSLSAKTKVWHGKITARTAGFAGLTELLEELAAALQLPGTRDVDALKASVLETMAGNAGLLLIDNLEQIDDPAVMKFLSLEVPAPVKVLVTSRIDRGCGGLTLSVPEMDELEARELLGCELRRAGFRGDFGDEEGIKTILTATGRVPLAMKWAAGIAAETTSLRECAARLRSASTTKSELLSFCLATMFDTLTPLARDVALLGPYLGASWNAATAALALDTDESEVSSAIEELKHRGVLLAAAPGREHALCMPALTTDFLLDAWQGDERLRQRVAENLGEAVAEQEGLFVHMPKERRVEVLGRRAGELLRDGQAQHAKRVLHVALSADGKSPRLWFLDGRVEYALGHYSEGLKRMRAAGFHAADDQLDDRDRLFLVEALLAHGGVDGEEEALHQLETLVAEADDLPSQWVGEFIKLALSQGAYRSLAATVRAIGEARKAHRLVRELLSYIDNQTLVFSCGTSLLHLLRAAAEYPEATEEERSAFREAAERCGGLLAKVSVVYQTSRSS